MSSKLEQEVKFYLNDPISLKKKLIDLGAELKQPRTHEINLRFDTPQGRLSGSFQVLRLRKDTRARLTFKGPSDPDSDVSAREELEVEVSDLAATRAILEALGFETMVTYEKYRSSYDLDGVEISLDEMPFGHFCEIEGPGTAAIMRCAERLGLAWGCRSRSSYLALFSVIKENLSLEMADLTFEAFSEVQAEADNLGLIPADSLPG